MAVAANDIIRVTAVMIGPAGKIENVFYFRANVVLDASDLGVMSDLALILDNAYDLLGSSLSSDTIFQEVRGFNVNANTPMPTVPWPNQVAGAGSADSAAPQISLGGFLRTGVSRAVSRKFVGGSVSGGFDTAGAWNGTNVTNMATFLASFIGSVVGATLNVYLPGIPSTVTSGFLSFLSAVAQNNPYTQRRRRFGRGE